MWWQQLLTVVMGPNVICFHGGAPSPNSQVFSQTPFPHRLFPPLILIGITFTDTILIMTQQNAGGAGHVVTGYLEVNQNLRRFLTNDCILWVEEMGDVSALLSGSSNHFRFKAILREDVPCKQCVVCSSDYNYIIHIVQDYVCMFIQVYYISYLFIILFIFYFYHCSFVILLLCWLLWRRNVPVWQWRNSDSDSDSDPDTINHIYTVIPHFQ